MWYDMPPVDRKALCLIMVRSQIPMIISAGKFMNLTLETYTNVNIFTIPYFNLDLYSAFYFLILFGMEGSG